MVRARRFSLLFLIVLTLCTALILAFYANPSLITFIVAGVALCQVTAIVARFKSKNAMSWAAVIGLVWMAAPLIMAISAVVIEQPKYQGQYYDEDGPFGFVIKGSTVLAGACMIGALVGGVIGAITTYFPIRNLRSS